MASTPVAPDMAPDVASLGPGRHEARERALGLLYESEVRELAAEALLADLPLPPNEYAVEAFLGVESAQARIDQVIGDHAEGWTVDRLPHVDRAILRLAVWELLERDDVPAAVIIDEAIELAKDYSTERSSGFVNGVLDSAAHELRNS